jgi:hypothetical protein
LSAHFTTAIVNDDGDARITCDTCAEAECAICGHEPCPICLDDCDHPDCIVWEGNGHGSKSHTCKFTACAKHRPGADLPQKRGPAPTDAKPDPSATTNGDQKR